MSLLIKIKLIKEISGIDLVHKMEKNYGSLKGLEMIYNLHKENTKLLNDLNEWKYYLANPHEKIIQTKVYCTEDLNLDKIELELLNFIKNHEPRSINDLSNIASKDIGSVLRKVKKLEEEGLISFEKGLKNSKKPVLNHDKIEIAI